MRIFIILLLFSAFASFACKTKKNTTNVVVVEEVKKEEKNNLGGDVVPILIDERQHDTMRMNISFFSIGGGIDYMRKKEVDKYLREYQLRNSKSISRKEYRWGKEGEIDYCFKLDELTKEQQDSFVSDIKNIVDGSDLIRIFENKKCREPLE